MKKRAGERGLALLVVLLTLALVASVVAEFQYSSSVDLQLAYNARDELQAEYNALTALRMRAMLLKESRTLQSQLGPALEAMGVGQIPITQMLDAVPVDCGLLSGIVRESDENLADSFADENVGEGEGEEPPSVFIGECEASSVSEHAKIPLNVLGSYPTRGEQTINMLGRMLSDPRFENHFIEDDRNGSHAENPQELVGAIADWVDRGNNQLLNEVSDEDRFYARLPDAYEAKNAPFVSVAELQMVHGVDDELYDILRDQVTIYTSNETIDLNSASPTQIALALAGALRDGVTLEQANPGFVQLFYSLAEMRAGTMGMGMLNVQTLSAMVESSGLGAFVDTTKFKDIFTDKPETTWFTITATGQVGNVQRTITAVFQANVGQFYYYRVE